MTTLVKFIDFPLYPEEYISKRLITHLKTDGLIEPLIVMPGGNIHTHDRARYMAFRQLAEAIGEVDTIIVCYWNEMSQEEKAEFPLRPGDIKMIEHPALTNNLISIPEGWERLTTQLAQKGDRILVGTTKPKFMNWTKYDKIDCVTRSAGKIHLDDFELVRYKSVVIRKSILIYLTPKGNNVFVTIHVSSQLSLVANELDNIAKVIKNPKSTGLTVDKTIERLPELAIILRQLTKD